MMYKGRISSFLQADVAGAKQRLSLVFRLKFTPALSALKVAIIPGTSCVRILQLRALITLANFHARRIPPASRQGWQTA
jgi:hypothetical protein